jgi:hypothetical protein
MYVQEALKHAYAVCMKLVYYQREAMLVSDVSALVLCD